MRPWPTYGREPSRRKPLPFKSDLELQPSLRESLFERCRPRAFLVQRRLASGEEGTALGKRFLRGRAVALQLLIDGLQSALLRLQDVPFGVAQPVGRIVLRRGLVGQRVGSKAPDSVRSATASGGSPVNGLSAASSRVPSSRYQSFM